MLIAGFDSYSYPSHGISTMDWLMQNTNLKWVGYYLAPAPDRINASWMGHRQELANDGWSIAPIYVGQQDSSAFIPSASQGAVDGHDATAKAWSEGFALRTTIYLDVEL